MTCPTDIKKAIATWIWSLSGEVWDSRYIFASHLHIVSFETLAMGVAKRGEPSPGNYNASWPTEKYDIIQETDKPPRSRRKTGGVMCYKLMEVRNECACYHTSFEKFGSEAEMKKMHKSDVWSRKKSYFYG